MKRIFFGLGMVGIIFFCYFFLEIRKLPDGKLHIVVCTVGQGDALLLKTPKGKIILVDGGPDEKVLSCLRNHMPLWHKTIDLVVLTHPHLDHFNGLKSVLERYIVLYYGTEKMHNETSDYKEFYEVLQKEKAQQMIFFAGDKIKFEDGVVLSIVGPSRRLLHESSKTGNIQESSEFGNVIIHLNYKKFDVLLTGDSQVNGLMEALSFGKIKQKEIEVLQVPHHGSLYGLTKELIEKIAPKMAFISVGKNKYGHPNTHHIQSLQSVGARVLRTDTEGEIHIWSNGNSWGF